MGFDNRYPYTDMHELNLDWILEQMKSLAAAWDAYQESLTGDNGEWPTFKAYIENEWQTYQDGLTGVNGEWPTFKAYMENAWQLYQDSLTGVNGAWPQFKTQMETEWQQFFDNYLQTLGVVQVTGSSTTSVMSQKASTDSFAPKADFEDVAQYIIKPTLDPDGNLIIENELVAGEWVDYTTGHLEGNQYTADYCRTGYIPVEPNTSYATRASTTFYALYDEDKTYISGGQSLVISTTAATKYLAICWKNHNSDIGQGWFVLMKGTVAITEYVAPTYLPTVLKDSAYVDAQYVDDKIDEAIADLHAIRISLPDEYDVVVGDTFQLFYKGIVKCSNPYIYNYVITCDIGSCFSRYYELTPTADDIGNKTLSIVVKDDQDNVIAYKDVTINIKAKATSPLAEKTVLCVGDSLTVNGEWVTELSRRLTGTGGSPAADNLTNIKFIGTKGADNAKWEGAGGWTFASYLDPMISNKYAIVTVASHDKTAADQHSIYKDSSDNEWKLETIDTTKIKIICTTSNNPTFVPAPSNLTWVSGGVNHSDIAYTDIQQAPGNPFWNINTNELDFANYASEQNVTNIDYCLILLGWNSTGTSKATYIANTTSFINALRDAFPSCKVILMGLEVPSLNGCGQNYGCAWNFIEKTDYVFNLNDWYMEMADTLNEVYFINIAGQFDSEYNFPNTNKRVNTRNATTEYFQYNGVHPATSGYNQIADATYRKMTALLS